MTASRQSLAIIAVVVAAAAAPSVAAAAEPLTAAQEQALKPGDSFRECDQCPEMIAIPPGRFLMGSPPGEVTSVYASKREEEPQHEVTIARPFAVGKFTVTEDEFRACLDDDGCRSWGRIRPRGRRPVRITWPMAKDYLSWVSHKTGKPYRLLSEAEWEYAARAGTTTPYYTGSDITHQQARFVDEWEEAKDTVDVGQYPPNPFGLYDMAGNLDAWVEDCWNGSYHGAPVDGSPWLAGDCEELRPMRGGSASDTKLFLRSAYRGAERFDCRCASIRAARTLEPWRVPASSGGGLFLLIEVSAVAYMGDDGIPHEAENIRITGPAAWGKDGQPVLLGITRRFGVQLQIPLARDRQGRIDAQAFRTQIESVLQRNSAASNSQSPMGAMTDINEGNIDPEAKPLFDFMRKNPLGVALAVYKDRLERLRTSGQLDHWTTEESQAIEDLLGRGERMATQRGQAIPALAAQG